MDDLKVVILRICDEKLVFQWIENVVEEINICFFKNCLLVFKIGLDMQVIFFCLLVKIDLFVI